MWFVVRLGGAKLFYLTDRYPKRDRCWLGGPIESSVGVGERVTGLGVSIGVILGWEYQSSSRPQVLTKPSKNGRADMLRSPVPKPYPDPCPSRRRWPHPSPLPRSPSINTRRPAFPSSSIRLSFLSYALSRHRFVLLPISLFLNSKMSAYCGQYHGMILLDAVVLLVKPRFFSLFWGSSSNPWFCVS